MCSNGLSATAPLSPALRSLFFYTTAKAEIPHAGCPFQRGSMFDPIWFRSREPDISRIC